MAQAKKIAKEAVKLPDLGASPKAPVTAYTLLNPNGGEIYKVDAKYPTQPPTRQCKFTVYWKDGPALTGRGQHVDLSD